ncbi:unnamed protein product [Knipowitschia caucasica]
MPPKPKPAEEDCNVSVSMLTAMLEQQKDFYRDLIKQQQDNFKSFVQMMMDNTNIRLDSIVKDLHDVKVSLQFTDGVVNDLRAEEKRTISKLAAFDTEINSTCSELKVLSERLEYFDNQTRRNNILVDGITNEREEKPEALESKIRQLITTKLCLDSVDIAMDGVSRLGQYRDQGRPRPILVRLQRFKDRQCILAAARKLKGTNAYIIEDFTDSVRRRRRELLPQLKAARERGDLAFLKYDKLIVRPRQPPV